MRRFAALAAMAALASAPAAAQPKPCLDQEEAESLALVAMPDILRQTGTVCAPRLSPDSLLVRDRSGFIAKYEREADRAWPDAQHALVKLSDPMAEVLLQSEYSRPLLVNLVVPLIVGRIDPRDCGVIDRLVTDLAPLPPRNSADAIVTTLRYLKQEQEKGRPVKVPKLPLCEDQ